MTVLATAQPARAQQPEGAPAESGQAPPLVAGWNNGFFIQSADGEHRLQIGATLHIDGRFAPGNEALVDTFAVRRGRPSFRGRVLDRFEFSLTPDFAGSTPGVQDAYVETRFSTSFRLRFGKAKNPYGHERGASVTSLLFLERALPTAMAPNREVGLQILGDLSGGRVSYLAGLFNGTRDGASADTDLDDNKELAGRVVLRPFVATPASPLAGLGLGLSATTSRQSTAAGLPTYRTTVFQQVFFSYDGATADGRLNRFSPYVSLYRRAFGGFWELGRSSVPVAKGGTSERIAHQAWQTALSWVLTGESASEAGVQPRTPFNFGNGGWGALQVALRYHALSVDPAAFELGLAAPESSPKARSWSAGVNWYLNRHVKYVFLFERTTFAGTSTADREPENVVAVRTQLSF